MSTTSQARLHHLGVALCHERPPTLDVLAATLDTLLDEGCQVSLNPLAARHHPTRNGLHHLPDDLDPWPSSLDALVVIGGDGSMLHTARISYHQALPLIGVHTGRLGFLTDVPPDALDQLRTMIQGHYHVDTRRFLTTTWEGDTLFAINDMTLAGSRATRLIEFDLGMDAQWVSRQRADGLIVATPTGSTAYALSAGGPICHPNVPAWVVTPLCPHTLTSRPIVVPETLSIHVHLPEHAPDPAVLTCDGQTEYIIPPGSTLHMTASERCLKLLHPPGYDYFTQLNRKLLWQRGTTADANPTAPLEHSDR